jgi:hypothetical protein
VRRDHLADDVSGEVWTVVCTDRGQHGARAMLNRLYAHSSTSGTVRWVAGVPRERADNLGGRSREARSQERRLRESQLQDAPPTSGVARVQYRCTTCGRDVQLQAEAVVAAMNMLRTAFPTRRELDVSYLG